MSKNPTRLITGMGGALVDMFANVSEAELAELGSPKSSMSLIDAARSVELQNHLRVHDRQAGGSAANTIAGIAALGFSCGFIGKLGDDALGEIFLHGFDKLRVRFPNPVAPAPTGHCLILITPDAERTMHTVLGASITTSTNDLDAQLLADTDLLFVEAYVMDSSPTQTAFLTAAQKVRAQGGRVALSLSDALCVARHRATLHDILGGAVDIVLANEAEALALTESDSVADAADWMLARRLDGAITRSAKGALVLDTSRARAVPALKIDDVVDLTGAGDQFAAGFLAALMSGQSPQRAAEIGAVAAAEVIRHFGPRPQTDILPLLSERGLSL